MAVEVETKLPTVKLNGEVQVSELPEASTPSGKKPAGQFVPLAAKAVAVPAFPVMLKLTALDVEIVVSNPPEPM